MKMKKIALILASMFIFGNAALFSESKEKRLLKLKNDTKNVEHKANLKKEKYHNAKLDGKKDTVGIAEFEGEIIINTNKIKNNINPFKPTAKLKVFSRVIDAYNAAIIIKTKYKTTPKKLLSTFDKQVKETLKRIDSPKEDDEFEEENLKLLEMLQKRESKKKNKISMYDEESDTKHESDDDEESEGESDSDEKLTQQKNIFKKKYQLLSRKIFELEIIENTNLHLQNRNRINHFKRIVNKAENIFTKKWFKNSSKNKSFSEVKKIKQLEKKFNYALNEAKKHLGLAINKTPDLESTMSLLEEEKLKLQEKEDEENQKAIEKIQKRNAAESYEGSGSEKEDTFGKEEESLEEKIDKKVLELIQLRNLPETEKTIEKKEKLLEQLEKLKEELKEEDDDFGREEGW